MRKYMNVKIFEWHEKKWQIRLKRNCKDCNCNCNHAVEITNVTITILTITCISFYGSPMKKSV